MPDLGNAYVNIVPKAPGIEGKIENLLNDGAAGGTAAGENIGKKLLGGISKLGVGVAVGKIVKDAFEAGGNLEQSFGGLDTIYGEASAAAKDYAMQAAQAGISANNYAEQAVSFGASLKQAFGGDTAAAADAANTAIMDMADNAAKMGTPLENLQNAYQGFAKQNYTMLDNLKLGYGGTKTEMERLLADAEKLPAAMGRSFDINNLGDVYEAIHLIQGELGLTGVAANEAKTTLTGSMNAVKASWENVMAALTTGEGLDTAMANLTESVSNFADNVLRMLSEMGPQLPGLILGLADVVVANAPSFLASGVELITQLAVGLIQGIPGLLSRLPEIFDAIFDAFGSIDWMQLGHDIVMGIIDGVWSMVGALWETMKNLGRRALQAARDELHVGSPSRVFADEVGRWIPAGLAEGIDDNLSPVDASVRRMSQASLASLRPASGADAGGGAVGPGMMDQLIEALRSMKYDFYMDGKQITDSVTIRQRNAMRSGGVA